MKTRNKITILMVLIAGVILSLNFTKNTDPIDLLLTSTKDPKLKEKILVFKKGGYEKIITNKKLDKEAIIKSAKILLGTPHQMGGLTKTGIDCSGLVMIAHQQNHLALPHDANEQARFGKITLLVKELKRCDLIFFHSTYNTSKLVTHSGIYLGKEQFIHVSSKKGVTISNVNSKYWSSHFLFGTRLR